MAKNLIVIQDIYKQFETEEVVTKVLYGISFTIQQGEFVAIMGPSGSGKSTLMHILSFLDRPTKGEYFFDGQATKDFDDDKLALLRNKKVGFVFQTFNLLPRTTVLDNVILPLQYSQKSVDKVKVATQALTAVGLEHRLNYFSNQLSGGEKQRVAIARALVNNPDIIFADEPTGNLDSKSGQQIMEIIDNLNQQGRTIIMVTHEKYTAKTAKRIINLKDGRVVADEGVTERTQIKEGLIK